jgi:hypothetical protein
MFSTDSQQITYGVMVGFRLVSTPIPGSVMAPTIVSSVRPIVSGIVGVFQHPFRKHTPALLTWLLCFGPIAAEIQYMPNCKYNFSLHEHYFV